MQTESNFLGYALLAGVAFFIFSKLRAGYREGANPDAYYMHCMTCGSDAVPNRHNKGSALIEVLLWLLFIIPGVIYSIWRRTSVPATCPVCSSASIVPKDAPAAVQHRALLHKS